MSNPLLVAVDDGWTAGNYNWADLFLIVGAVAALLAAFAYGSGNVRTSDAAPRTVGWHRWAACLLAVAVAAVAFALFLL